MGASSSSYTDYTSTDKSPIMPSHGDIRSFIQAENSSHSVVVWSKSFCPYCIKTKKLFQSLNVKDIAIHELDHLPNGEQIQQELSNLTGLRTVPNVFVSNQHMGGNDDTHRAHRSGELERLLRSS